MASTNEYTINGVTFRVSLEVTNVDRRRVIEELSDRDFPTTDENINKVIRFIKEADQYDLETLSLEEIAIGESSGAISNYSIYDNTFEFIEDLETEED